MMFYLLVLWRPNISKLNIYIVWSPYLLVLKCVNYGDQKIASYKRFKHHYKKEKIIYLYHQMNQTAQTMNVNKLKKLVVV